MKIAPNTVVTLSFDISTLDGEIVESSSISGPVTFVHGKGGVLPGLERRIEGMAAGESASFELPPAEAFGEPSDAPVKTIPRAEFPSEGPVQVGAAFEAKLAGGQSIKLEVIEVTDEEVKARLIHPLAGQTIAVSTRIAAVRAATRAEQQTGRVVATPPPPPRK
ncbi:MAG: peptidylprolyl isomerase [Myxococcales bacterium FL481]|nr:MAG: peptidylprolyl isomerase [Myxococcales bacterium FL481]